MDKVKISPPYDVSVKLSTFINALKKIFLSFLILKVESTSSLEGGQALQHVKKLVSVLLLTSKNIKIMRDVTV